MSIIIGKINSGWQKKYEAGLKPSLPVTTEE
jgi:hypothetical protein